MFEQAFRNIDDVLRKEGVRRSSTTPSKPLGSFSSSIDGQNARDLFEGYLQSVFTQRGAKWVRQRLGEMATFRNGINFTRSSRGAAVRIVGVKDFQSNYWAPLDNLEQGTLSDLLCSYSVACRARTLEALKKSLLHEAFSGALQAQRCQILARSC